MKVQRVGYFTIRISVDEQDNWNQIILGNGSMTPEIIGQLMGRAKPVIVDVKCRVCDKAIETKHQAKVDQSIGNFSWHNEMHQICFDNKRKVGLI